jgi:hypothetical protein
MAVPRLAEDVLEFLRTETVLPLTRRFQASPAQDPVGGAIQDPNKLTGPELDFILRTLKTCTLKGEQIEQFYNIVVKLQNQYMDNNIK